METPIDAADIERNRLLFDNDRRIKGLIVNYHLEHSTPGPWIAVRLASLASFRADLELLDRVRRKDLQSADSYKQWRFEEWCEHEDGVFTEGRHWRYDEEPVRNLAEFLAGRPEFEKQFGRDAFEAQLWMHRRFAQETHLSNADRQIRLGLSQLLMPRPRLVDVDEFLGKLHDSLDLLSRELVFSEPYSLELMHTPLKKGDSKEFKNRARSSLDEFRTRFGVLFPLVCPVSATILFVPPERAEEKDLDNLARLVIPFVHEALQPPATDLHAIDIDNIKDQNLKQLWQNQKERLPKMPPYSVKSYQVFEIPRKRDDPPEGFVRLALGSGTRMSSFWRDVDDYLDKWKDEVDRY